MTHAIIYAAVQSWNMLPHNTWSVGRHAAIHPRIKSEIHAAENEFRKYSTAFITSPAAETSQLVLPGTNAKKQA